MRNLDTCHCWRCTFCPCKVRNKFLVNFWNRTIQLCIPCIRRQLKFEERKFCVTLRGGTDTEKRKRSSLWNIMVWKTKTWATDCYGNRTQTHQWMKQRMCDKMYVGRHFTVARDCSTLKEGTVWCPEKSVTNSLSTLHNIPEERKSHLYRDRSLKSRNPMP